MVSHLMDSCPLMHSAPLHGMMMVEKKQLWLSWWWMQPMYLRPCLDSSLPQLEFTVPGQKSAMPCWYRLLASSTYCCQPVNTPWSPENLSSCMLSHSPSPSFPFSPQRLDVQLFRGVTSMTTTWSKHLSCVCREVNIFILTYFKV